MATTIDDFKRLQERAKRAQKADEDARRDLAVAEAQLAQITKEIEQKYGKGSADIAKLRAAEAKAQAEVEKLSTEIDALLRENGF